MLILAHFPANFLKCQIFLEQSIFVVQKRLVYEKAYIFDEECNKIKILDCWICQKYAAYEIHILYEKKMISSKYWL